jgi:Ca-activated chloride channel family protein
MLPGAAVVAILAASIGLIAAAQTPQAPQPGQVPSFRATVDMVSLNVTVAEAAAGTPRYVKDLDLSDFEVYEDGTKQDVILFNKSNSPIALSLLMDSSASMQDKLGEAQEAAIGFARRVRSEDLAEVIDFDSRAVIAQAFTSDVAQLEHAIRMSTAGGPTSMRQALYIAMSEFKKLKKSDVTPEQIRRQAVVLLSDGVDTNSMFSFDDILDIVKRSETAVYSIGLRSPEDLASKEFKTGDFELRQLAQQTGGRAFFPKQLSDLNGVYAEIADELASQYTLGYSSRNQRHDGTWRRIVVRVNRPNIVVRTKQGYFAPKT